MAAPAQKLYQRININLLYPQGSGVQLPLRFLRWLLSYGRFIVILVEIVVIIAFVMRFKLDADLSSLKEEIDYQIPYLENSSYLDTERLVVLTQKRLSALQSHYNSAPEWSKFLTAFSSELPLSTRLTSLTVDRPQKGSRLNFKLNAQTTSVNDLAVLLNNLRSNTQFRDINLASISFDQEAVTFSITGSVK